MPVRAVYVRSMPDLDIATRTGLPDALRVLVDALPRATWEEHPEFDGLTRFWLDRHLMFRDLQGRLLSETAVFLDRGMDPDRFGRTLHRLAGLFLNELHGHHGVEDTQYFPVLRRIDPRLAMGFDLLDADHHSLEGHLMALADDTNAVLRSLADTPADRAPAGRLQANLGQFARFLDRHLTDEEDLVVPVLLASGGAGRP